MSFDFFACTRGAWPRVVLGLCHYSVMGVVVRCAPNPTAESVAPQADGAQAKVVPAPQEDNGESHEQRSEEVSSKVAGEGEVGADDCEEAGSIVDNAWDVMDTDPQTAITTITALCDRGCAYGCEALGSAYGDGFGVAKDPARSQAAYAKACELDPSLCD